MKILVIIPVFNEEKNLEKCLKSFLKQTYPITQITVVDDGSTDSTSNILNTYSKKIKPLIIYLKLILAHIQGLDQKLSKHLITV